MDTSVTRAGGGQRAEGKERKGRESHQTGCLRTLGRLRQEWPAFPGARFQSLWGAREPPPSQPPPHAGTIFPTLKINKTFVREEAEASEGAGDYFSSLKGEASHSQEDGAWGSVSVLRAGSRCKSD